MSKNAVKTDETSDKFDSELEEESSTLNKNLLSKEKMDSKRRLEEYLENKRLEEELNSY
jgi:hypothetical protein